MAAEQVDYLGTDSGLVDECEGTILAARAHRPEKYPSVLVEWTIGTDLADAPEIKESYSIGKGWESLEDGAVLAHEAGDGKRFQANSGYGQIIDAAIKTMGIGDILRKRGGDPRKVGLFVGLRFRFERVERAYSIKLIDAAQIAANGGKELKSGTTSRLMPVEFLGVDESIAATAGTAATTDVLTQLTELAKSVDEATFKTQALNLPGADKHLAQILDGSIYKAARG